MTDRFIGAGLAMVDEKIQKAGLSVGNGNIREFLDAQPETIKAAGGVTPNILATFNHFDQDYQPQLVARTGNDERGTFYRSRTANLGEIQVDPNRETGVVASFIDSDGTVYYRDRDLGAATHLEIGSEHTEGKVELFVSDLTTLRHPRIREGANELLSLSKGQFFLNLAGLNPAVAGRQEQLGVIDDLHREPDIVTGNEQEFAYLLDDPDFSVEHAFPNSRLLILTLAGQGSIVRFEGEKIHIPPSPVERVVDETGAGDTYAGLMLGTLHTEPYARWDKKHVLNACETAAYGAAMVVETSRTRLTGVEMADVRDFYTKLRQVS